ncbi:MAG TPA: iron-containing redox enzyme family protein [Gemmataceae bacterium]|jgi:hypothetical protein|nr:iron-containing redox enzyme family protein [Gemmataceae bacterium]
MMSESDCKPLEEMERRLRSVWDEVFRTCPLIHAIQKGEINRALYALYLFQTYHYTLHNSRNQALVGVRSVEENGPYLNYCFSHAADEAGHEQMALHDIKSIGLPDAEQLIPAPLAETEVLIAYLYWVSATGNPFRRLGYSFWAEGAYEFIGPLIDRVRTTLQLRDSQMTFFVAHARIDEEHFAQVRRMLRSNCRTAADWAEAGQVMETSLRLTGRMMSAVHAAYESFRQGNAEQFAFLRSSGLQ